MSYFDCALTPVPVAKVESYRRFSSNIAEVFREYGALRVVDCVLDPEASNGVEFHAEAAREALQGQSLRDFPMAAASRDGEVVILSWTEWPSKSARDEGMKQALADPRVQPKDGEETLFEGRRLIAGSFFKLVDV